MNALTEYLPRLGKRELFFLLSITRHFEVLVFFQVLKDLNSTVAKRGSVFIGLMTPDGAIWFRHQRAVLMR